ncbi:DUF481 domain-containing protein [Sphingomonas jatrophae]|uniref:Putative salt-induced outer membrane protein n=1 Tax=Sphingomonas jatrophae TaxID=1166337 RepID=A0A1I6M3D6_9SPHN|nr:DUF481 domain-containing protein [Sphingomonas jatrophae]SFS10237.1 putative salt-induced outer membrane protein [Sphingomonas jatrophae]
MIWQAPNIDLPPELLPLQVVVVVAAPEMPPLLLTPPRPADAPPELPRTVRDVIEAAIDSGDPAAVAAVVKFARASNPETASEIDTIHKAYLARLAAREAREKAAKREALAAAGPLDFWKGTIEVGATRATGNSDTLGLYGSLGLTREGLLWTHKLVGRIDYQRTDETTTASRALLSWQPRRTLGERFYGYGLAQYERDRFLGYSMRLTGGGGLGYRLVAQRGLQLDLEGGPALRRTNFTDEAEFTERTHATTLAGRASLALRWKVSPTLDVTQDSSIFVERGATNASATTALDTRLIGGLKARISYALTYERDAPDGREPLDTLGRATLVYSF